MTHDVDRFVQKIRTALHDSQSPGFIDGDEMSAAMASLAPQEGSTTAEIQADVLQDLLDRSYRPRRLGGVPMAPEGREQLKSFVGRHDQGRPGLWLDPPRGAEDGVSSFVSRVRGDTANGRRLGASTVRSALSDLENANVDKGIKAHLAEKLLLSSDANHGTSGLPIDERAAEQLADFKNRLDPTHQGIGWFEKP